MFLNKIKIEKLISILEGITTFDGIIELIRELPTSVVDKLYLIPDGSLHVRLNHFLAVLKFSLENIEVLRGIEGISIYNSTIDFDVLLQENETTLIAFDLTSDRSTITAKRLKMTGIAEDLQKQLNSLGVNLNVISDVLLYEQGIIKSIPLRRKKSLFFEQTYKIIRSINSENYDEYVTIAQKFLKKFYDKITGLNLDPKLEADDDRQICTDSEGTLLIDSVQENSESSIEKFMSVSFPEKSFPEKCKNLIRKLDSLSNKSNVKKWVYKYYPAVPEKIENRTIPIEFTFNPILMALNKIISRNDDSKFYKVTEEGEIEAVREPSTIFAPNDCVLVAKMISPSEFKIYFSKNYIDGNLMTAIIRKQEPSPKVITDTEYFLKDITSESDGHNAERIYTTSFESVVHKLTQNSRTSYCDKITKVVESSDQSGSSMLDKIAFGTFSSFINNMKETITMNVLEHESEIAKAFDTTLGACPKNCNYKLVYNSSFKSITLKQLNSTLDSFTNAFYIVFYQTESNRKFDETLFRSYYRRDRDIIQSESSAFNRNTLSWELRKFMTTIATASWLAENKEIPPGRRPLDITEAGQLLMAYNITTVNRNQFAIVSELCRYLYISTSGRSSRPSEILSKFENYRPRTIFEIVYCIRMLKMAGCLYALKNKGLYHKIKTLDRQSKEVLNVSFPHEFSTVKDFNYSISSFYICNIFNKYRYNDAVSAAHCFNGLLEEDSIYKDKTINNEAATKGLSQFALDNKITDFKTLVTTYENEELEHLVKVYSSEPSRYRFSITYLLSVFLIKSHDTTLATGQILNKLQQSVIDSCTAKGAMNGQIPTKDRQSIRSASSILEGILKDYDADVEIFNKGDKGQEEIIARLSFKSTSLLTLMAFQYCKTTKYAFRIVHKDQKGDREISVCNYEMRIGSKFLEELSRGMSKDFPINVLENPSKQLNFQDLISKTSEWNTEDKICVYDNNDQKRWGPNHLTVSFYAMIHVFYINVAGLRNLAEFVCKNFEEKVAKYPESSIELINADVKFSSDRTMGKFLDKIRPNILTGQYGITLPWGMCQGILHETSSVYHSIIATELESVLLSRNIVEKIETRVTSDDSFRAMLMQRSGNLTDKLSSVFVKIRGIGNLCNILRSDSKSVFNTLIAEFNSDFYVGGRLYVPNLKQRISKLDVGNGSDYIEDISTALSYAAQFLSSGGTYFGATVIQVLNIVFVTDQWRRWYQFSKSDKDMISKSVFLGGIPLISPALTSISGPISNIVLKDIINESLSIPQIASFLSNLGTAPEEIVEQEEVIRGNSTITKDYAFSYYQNVSFSGFIPLSRPRKHASQFNKRHHLKAETLKSNDISLDRNYPSFNNLVLRLALGLGQGYQEDHTGTNTIIARFADPYVNIDAKRFRIAKVNSLYSVRFKDEKYISLRQLEEFYESDESETILRNFINIEEFSEQSDKTLLAKYIAELLVSAMVVLKACNSRLLTDAKSDEIPQFKVSRSLTSHFSILDEETFRLSCFKTLAKQESLPVLIKMGYQVNTINNLIELFPHEKLSLAASVTLTERVNNNLGRYFKQKTKGVYMSSGTTKDLHKTIFDAIYYNFSTAKSIKPPSLELPPSGKIIKIVREKELEQHRENSNTFLRIKSKTLHNDNSEILPTLFLNTKLSNNPEEFEIIDRSLVVSQNTKGDVMVINKGSSRFVKKRLDSLIPYNNSFKFSSTALIDLDFKTTFLNGEYNHNNSFISMKSLDDSPFHVVTSSKCFYIIENRSGFYTHNIFLLDPSDLKRNQTELEIQFNPNFKTEEIWQIKLRDEIAKRRFISFDKLIDVGKRDRISVSLINKRSLFKLNYSNTSNTVCLEFKGRKIPYCSLPFQAFEHKPLNRDLNIELKDLKALRRELEELLYLAQENEEVRNKLYDIINVLSIPYEKSNFDYFCSRITRDILSLEEEGSICIKSFETNPEITIFMFIATFNKMMTDSITARHTNYKTNYSKSANSTLFKRSKTVEKTTRPISFEVSEKLVEKTITALDRLNILDLDEEDEDYLENENYEGGTVISGSIRDALANFDLFDDVVEDKEDKVILAEANDYEYSSYHNFSDQQYMASVQLLTNQMADIALNTVDFVNQRDDFIHILSSLKFSDKILKSMFKLIYNFVDLPKYALMLLSLKGDTFRSE